MIPRMIKMLGCAGCYVTCLSYLYAHTNKFSKGVNFFLHQRTLLWELFNLNLTSLHVNLIEIGFEVDGNDDNFSLSTGHLSMSN